MKRRTIAAWTVFGLLLSGTVYLGWRSLWFLTDDAFIHFRYVSNAMAGRGLVWNPEPFLPVDGYTQFLWVVLLSAVWWLFGVEPPDAANTLGLLFGYGTLFLVWRMTADLTPRPSHDRMRGLAAALVLVGVATHREFLTWLSSGLGTSMFVFCFVWWVREALALRHTAGAGWRLSTSAALAALTRPDGLLIAAATAVILLRRAWLHRVSGTAWRIARGAAPLLLVAAHLVWHRLYYGEYLPNTYYAKHVGPWPESGIRYLGSYIVEFGGWLWLGLAAVWCARGVLRGGWLRAMLTTGFDTGVVVGTVAIHAAYYTFAIGGDHFEYRVYAQLTPLLLFSFLWLARDVLPGPRWTVSATALAVALGHAVTWIQYSEEPVGRIAHRMPGLLRPLFTRYDDWQDWLRSHAVCQRHFVHREFLRSQLESLPPRAVGSKIGWDERPVRFAQSVGVVGWTLPNVAIIDCYGLNDWVIARTPRRGDEDPADRARRLEQSRAQLVASFERIDRNQDDIVDHEELLKVLPASHAFETIRLFDTDRDGVVRKQEVAAGAPRLDQRHMAHDRLPPAGYVEGFRPNVEVVAGRYVVEARERPLTDEDIRAHEREFRALVSSAARSR